MVRMRLALLMLLWSAHVCTAQGDATTRLFDAIANEDPIAVRAALADHPSFTAFGFRGDTVLTAAAEQGNATIFKLVLDASPDINQQNSIGRTALITAVWLNQMDVLRVLLPRHPNLDVQDMLGESALFYTQSGRHDTTMLKMLLEAGANPNLVDKAGQTPLSQAILWSQYEAEQVLIKAGAHPVGVTDEIYSAAASGDIATLTRLLEEEHVDPNQRPAQAQPLICVAAQKGNTVAVKVLLAHGADPNILDNNRQPPLYWALTSRQRSTVDVLLAAYANLLTEMPGHRTLLAVAAAYSTGDTKLLAMFLDAGVEINQRDSGGETALMAAASAGDEAAVRFLLKRGADPTVVDRQNHSAYWYAERRKEDGLARTLEKAAESWKPGVD